MYSVWANLAERWLLESYVSPCWRICIFIGMFSWSAWYKFRRTYLLHSLPLHVLVQCVCVVQFVQWLVLLECPSCGEHSLHLLDWTDCPSTLFMDSLNLRCSICVQCVCVVVIVIQHSCAICAITCVALF